MSLNLYKFKYIQNTEPIEPVLELYKGKLYSILNKLFINDSINILGKNIFSIKKSYSRTLTNILACWLFSLYIDYDFSDDYFFPNNYENTDIIKNIFNDLCKYDINIINSDLKINLILNNLKKNYKYQLQLLNEYKKSNIFIKNINNYLIFKKKIKLKNNKKLFYKFEIQTKIIIKEEKLKNILNNLLIPIKVYYKLINKYTGELDKIDIYIWSLLFRYQLLGSNNHQLAILPNILENMKIDYNLNFECFASAINSTFDNYCSIYYDIEKYFGSVGNFFNIIPINGTYSFNPPFQKEIITNSIIKILEYLNDNNTKLTFIVTIPIWDLEGKEIMKKLYNNDIKKQNINYGDFEIINIIKSSIYLKYLKMIPKHNFTYIDHNFELLKNKTIQNTYIIILSNIEININMIDNYLFE
jgi:galactitol-specific phosphotransferase system IIB component